MQRKVTITMWVDPKDYHKAVDSDRGAVELAKAILKGGVDYPTDEFTIVCGSSMSFGVFPIHKFIPKKEGRFPDRCARCARKENDYNP